MSEQIAVRIPEGMAGSLKDLVDSGRFETKADAIRAALEALIETERRKRVGELIAEGYRRVPQADDELGPLVEHAPRRALDALEVEEDEAGLAW